MAQEESQQIALFRYGIISDFVNQKEMARGEKEELLKYKSSRTWIIPYSDRKYISQPTILNWIRLYKNGGQTIESLLPRLHFDRGTSRTIDRMTAKNLIKLLKNSNITSVKTLINEMRSSGLVERGTSLKPSSVYRFLKNNGLNEYIKKPKGRKEDIKEVAGRNKFWMRKLSHGKIGYEEIAQDLSAKLPTDEIKILHNAILVKPYKFRRRALAILFFSHGISSRSISEFLFMPRSTVLYYLSFYKKRGITKLLEHKRENMKKYEDPKYAKELFCILHSPPSTYGFNRTTWRQKDLQKAMTEKGLEIAKSSIARIIKIAGYRYRKAKTVLTSNDPQYQEKVQTIKGILANLKRNDKFFSVDEYGPFAVRMQGGKSLTPPGQIRTVPQWQKNKGSIIITAALELSTNQIAHFYSPHKNSTEMIKLLEILIDRYRGENCFYFSWDAASWHASKQFEAKVKEINEDKYRLEGREAFVKLAPLPTGAQFLNVIESVLSGMARAIIHNSNYESVDDCIKAIDRYFLDRNEYFEENPKRAGKKIWGQERVEAVFNESNNCKDPMYS